MLFDKPFGCTAVYDVDAMDKLKTKHIGLVREGGGGKGEAMTGVDAAELWRLPPPAVFQG